MHFEEQDRVYSVNIRHFRAVSIFSTLGYGTNIEIKIVIFLDSLNLQETMVKSSDSDHDIHN